MHAQIQQALDANQQWWRELFNELVSTNSYFENQAGVSAVQGILERELKACGLDCEYFVSDDSANHLLARNNISDKCKRIILSCHADTVYLPTRWSTELVDQADGWALGPGSADMKGGVTVILLAVKLLRQLNQLNKVPLLVVSNSAEETVINSFGRLIESIRQEALLALTFEAARVNGGTIIERKGRSCCVVKVKGKEAHAGNSPQSGINAIVVASNLILELQKLNDYPKGKTCNVGVIRGGTVTNTVPGSCKFELELRANTVADLDALIESTKKLSGEHPSGANVSIEIHSHTPPLEATRDSQQKLAELIVTASNWDLNLTQSPRVGGLSDANYFAGADIPTIDGLGPYGENFHVVGKERVLLTEIPKRAAMIAEWLLTKGQNALSTQ